MARDFEVTAPDGSKFVVTAPEGATREQVLRFAQQQFQQQQQSAPQQRQQRTVAPTPPPEMMAREQQAQRQRAAEAAAYSRARSPSGRMEAGIEQEIGVFERARRAAEAAGVDPTKSAPTEARIALALAAPSATEPSQQADVVRNALGDEYEVRVGPDTNQVEWRKSGEEQYSLVNPPGFDFRDLAQATPETATLATGALTGTGGLFAGAATGSLVKPGAGTVLGGGAGTTIGVGLGEGAATKFRLELARDKGYLPEITDEEISRLSLNRGLEASAWTAGGGVVARGARQLLARQLGASAEVIEALANTPDVDEAFEQASRIQREVETVTGERPPLTAGQAADSPEMRLAEQTAARQGRANITDIFSRQSGFQRSLEQSVLGTPITPDEAASVSRAFERKAQQDIARLEGRVEQAVSPLRERAGFSPEKAAALARGEIVLGRKRLFDETFAPEYQAIFENAELTPADLKPLRDAARDLIDERGQSILPSISIADQTVLKEAETAGLAIDNRLALNSNNLLEWQEKLVSQNTSLLEVQNALVDIRRARRQAETLGDRQKISVLNSLESSLERIRLNAVGPQKAQQLDNLDRRYAIASSDYNQSFIEEFTTLRPDGTPIVTSDQAFERIIRSPEEAATFIDALGRIPTGPEALSQFKRGVIGRILDRATKDGEISDSALRSYLTPQRLRALESIFEGEDIASQFDNVKNAVAALKTRRNEYRAGVQVRDRILGENFVSPRKIANEVYTKIEELTPERINTVRTSLPKTERALFDRALATEIRSELVDSRGRVVPEKIDRFLESQASRASRSVFGKVYLSNLRTLRDFARLRQPVTARAADRPIDETLAQTFQLGIGGAEGLQKFLRVPFPPLSVRGRALTATLGQLQEKGQQQLAEILADPQRFADLRRLLSTDFYSRNFDKIAARLGLASIIQFKDIIEGNIAIPETAEEQDPTAISPTL